MRKVNLFLSLMSADPIFSEKMMGDGVAILVKGDTIYAPCDAKVATNSCNDIPMQ